MRSAPVFLRSLDAVLTGTIATSKSVASNNSYAYRELLNLNSRRSTPT